MPLAITFRVQNIIDHGGILLSIAGLVVVFVGLILISLFIQWLPNALALFDRVFGTSESASAHAHPVVQEAEDTIDRDVAVAIATVLERELAPEDGSAMQRITIRRSPGENLWRISARMRVVSPKPSPPKTPHEGISPANQRPRLRRESQGTGR